jgi:hypothetical protein
MHNLTAPQMINDQPHAISTFPWPNVPALMPDEIDRSYLGRFMLATGAATQGELLARMADSLGTGAGEKEIQTRIELLCEFLQMSTTEFCRNHTMLPIRRAVTSYFPSLNHGDSQMKSMLKYSGVRLARPGAFCCTECIQRDQQVHGVGFWHRCHQIPGQLWCPEHEIPLAYIDNDDAFLSPPESWQERYKPIAGKWVDESKENVVVQRFLGISLALLNRASPFSVRTVSEVLKKQGAKLGFQTNAGNVKAKLFSDELLQSLPREWLFSVMPALVGKKTGKIMPQIDGVFYMKTSSSSATAYLLALAVLFETPEVALSELAAADNRNTSNSKANRSSPAVSDKDLRSAYLGTLGEYQKIAEQLNMGYSTACARLRSMGLVSFSNGGRSGLAKAAISFYSGGKSVIESAIVGGVTSSELEEIIRNGGSELIAVVQARHAECRKANASSIRRPQKLLPHEITENPEHILLHFSRSRKQAFVR